ncbi:MAG: hypothetical protein V1804_01970 [Patescibacteria group bacterium]
MGEIGNKKMFLDSAFAEGGKGQFLVSNKIYQDSNYNLKSTLFSRGRIMESFFTEDSGLYISPKEQKLINEGIKISRRVNIFDGISTRVVAGYRNFRPREDDFLYKKLVEKYEKVRQNFSDLPQNFIRRISLIKLWNLSIASAIILGMVSMTFIYRYLGAGVSAEGSTQKVIANAPVEQVLGAEDMKSDLETTKYIEDIIQELEASKKEEFEKEVSKMVRGYPIEKMVPDIAEKDKLVATFLIGIAKKESGWGAHVPVLDGKDCFNYWGYRGIRKKMGTGGHTCFDSRKDAVDTVAKRLGTLIEDKQLNTPAKMVVWKCGSACSKDDQEAVRKWISDVDIYFKKLND